MSLITLLGGGSPDLEAELQRLAALRRPAPFAPERVQFVTKLAQRLVAGPHAREFPELVALGHWFREAALLRMRQAFDARHGPSALITRARGLVFLLPPANVDALFGYAWLLSLLAGNATLVRVSQKQSPTRDRLLSEVRALAAEHPSALADTWIVTYAHDDAITARLSMACDARLVWGGDDTVRRVRAIPLKPTAVEAVYPDRFSCAVFDAAAMLAVPDEELDQLTAQFANDTLWSDQQACSSPKAIFWVGVDPVVTQAQERFWRHFAHARALQDPGPAARVARITDMLALAAQGTLTRLLQPLEAYPARATGPRLDRSVIDSHGGHGWFFEVAAPDVDAVAEQLEDRIQTVVAHGLSREDAARLVNGVRGRGVDRIVRIGRAVEFDHVWDGDSLFNLLTRLITVETTRARTHGSA